jgi:Transposase DDE domain
MSIIGTVARTLQAILGPALDVIGRQTGVIQRRRKFSGASLFQTIVLTVMKSPNAKTDDFVATAARLGVNVTPTAIEKRFTDRLVTFLRSGLEHVMGQVVVADPVAIPLLQKFSAVDIGDSTTVTVPDEYAAEFPGCGGTSGSGKAAVKIQASWDLRAGKLKDLQIQPGRHSDAKSFAPDAPAEPGALKIYDLGYFSLERFQRWGSAGVYWISRWQPGTAVFDANGSPLDLLRYVREQPRNVPIDLPILLGAGERVPCRMIVLRVPQEVAARRRQNAYKRAQKHGTVPSADQLAWCEWTILVTNCPPELLTWKEVVVLYRARWQIELMFKLWKSQNHLATHRENHSPEERMALFWAKLIGVILQHWLLLMSTWSNPRRSHWKAAQIIRDTIVSLTGALTDLGALIAVLEGMTAAINAVANKKTQKKSPSSFQLLLDPELLDWSY